MIQTHNKNNQKSQCKENKSMLSYAAILKNEKQKQKTPENKNEEPERRREINRNFQQQNDQPTPLNKQTHHERYKDIRVLPYH